MNRHERRKARALGLAIVPDARPLSRVREYRGFTVNQRLDARLRAAHEAVLADDGHRIKPTFHEFAEHLLALGVQVWEQVEEKRKARERRIIEPGGLLVPKGGV